MFRRLTSSLLPDLANSTTTHTLPVITTYRINENLFALFAVPLFTAVFVGGIIFLIATYSGREDIYRPTDKELQHETEVSRSSRSVSSSNVESEREEYHPPYHGGVLHGDTATSMQYQRSIAYTPRRGHSDSISNSHNNMLSTSAEQAPSQYDEQDFEEEGNNDSSADDAVLSPRSSPHLHGSSEPQSQHSASSLNLSNHAKTQQLTDNDSKSAASDTVEDTDTAEYRQLTERLIHSISDTHTKRADVLEGLNDLQHLLVNCTENQRYVARSVIVNTIVNQHGLDILQLLSTKDSESESAEVASTAEKLLQHVVPLIWSM